MLSLPDTEWVQYGRMAVARWLDADLAKRVYLELLRLDKAARLTD